MVVVGPTGPEHPFWPPTPNKVKPGLIINRGGGNYINVRDDQSLAQIHIYII